MMNKIFQGRADGIEEAITFGTPTCVARGQM